MALVILSVMAAMAWKGLDGITRAREIADGALKRTLRMQSVMQQWSADLNAVVDTGVVQALQFDGAALRLTRQTTGGVQVVVWALRSGRWVRWAGPAVTNVGLLQDQWLRSFNFQGASPVHWPPSRGSSSGRCIFTGAEPGPTLSRRRVPPAWRRSHPPTEPVPERRARCWRVW